MRPGTQTKAAARRRKIGPALNCPLPTLSSKPWVRTQSGSPWGSPLLQFFRAATREGEVLVAGSCIRSQAKPGRRGATRFSLRRSRTGCRGRVSLSDDGKCDQDQRRHWNAKGDRCTSRLLPSVSTCGWAGTTCRPALSAAGQTKVCRTLQPPSLKGEGEGIGARRASPSSTTSLREPGRYNRGQLRPRQAAHRSTTDSRP